MGEEQSRLVEINKFLKKQNQAIMKMLEGYAALHFYYQQIFTKRDIRDVVNLLFEFIDNIFDKIELDVECAVFFHDADTFEFKISSTFPDSVDKELFNSQLYDLTENGVVGWSITNQKISFFDSSRNERLPYGLLLPLFTSNRTLGLLVVNVDCDASFITHETLQILELACSQTSLFLDNLKFID